MMRDGATALASGQSETIIDVTLPGRSYPIVIGEGLIASAGRRIAAALTGARCAVVSDRNVAALYLEPLKASLDQHGLFLGEAIVSPGEASKSFPVLAPLCESLLELGVERGDCVIALGGGVVGDLAGFAASILRRGVRVVQMPTSLLAQVDSSVGGKTGIDTRQGKNLIGTFHQPSLVLADISVLSTLEPARVPRGLCRGGEIRAARRCAVLRLARTDIGARSSRRQAAARRRAVETSVRAKAAIVAADEREETGTRALLNLGHTFGHALEAFAGYSDRLLHGEAIAIGMRLAFAFSVEHGLCPPDDAVKSSTISTAVGLPIKIAAIPGTKPSPDELSAADGPGQEGERRQARAGAGARHRPGVRRARRAPAPADGVSHPGVRRKMTLGLGITLGAIFGLLLASAFFSGSETALTAASRAKMHALEEDGQSPRARGQLPAHHPRALHRRHPARQQPCQYRRLGAGHQPVPALFGEAGVVYATIVMTVIVVLFAEVLPKTYAILNADRMALAVAPPSASSWRCSRR